MQDWQVKPVGNNNFEKVCRLIERCGLKRPTERPTLMTMLTAFDGEKRRILGTASVQDGWLAWVAVSPDYRRLGIGRRLVAALKPQAHSLHVKTTNYKAIRLYHSEGYRLYGFDFKKRSIIMSTRKRTISLPKRKSHGLPRQLKLGKLYSVNVEANELDDRFFDFLEGMLVRARNGTLYQRDHEAETAIITLSKKIKKDKEWRKLVVAKGEFRGKWTTRFSKLYKQETGKELPEDTIRYMGNEIQALYRPFTGTLHFVIGNREVDWMAGKFGDRDSCMFRSGRFSYNHEFEKNPTTHFWIKLYESAEAYKQDPSEGIGRCWMYRLEDGELAVTNAYGKIYIQAVAKALALLTKRVTSPAYLRVDGPIYTNGDSHIVIPPKVRKKDAYHV